MEILERPYNISYSLNDIRYVFHLEDAKPLQVKLLAKPLGGTYAEVYTFLLQPAPDGMIYLYVQEYINSLLTYVLPAFDRNTRFTNADKQACIFTIHYREVSGEEEDYITTEETDYLLYAIKGGIEKHLHSRNNIFLYLAVTQQFLTWQPTKRFIDKNETAYLTFLNPGYDRADLTQAFSFCYKMTDVNGNTYSDALPFAITGLLFHMCIAAGLLPAGDLIIDELYTLECGVVKDGDPVVYTHTFYFEYRPVYEYHDLVLHNSLGGIDFVRVKGEVAESFERTITDGAAGKDVLDLFAAYKAPEAFFPGISLQRKYKGDVGYLMQKHLQYALVELLVSHSIYMRAPFRWVPVVNLQKSGEMGAKGSSRNSFPVEWALSESNEVYTPEIAIAMGNIDMMPVIEIPEPLAVINIIITKTGVNDDGFVTYQATFTVTGTADHFQLELKSVADWLNVTSITNYFDGLFTNNTVHYNLGSTEDQDHDVRIRPYSDATTAGTAGEAHYAISIAGTCPVVSNYQFYEGSGVLHFNFALPTSSDPDVVVNDLHYELWVQDTENGDQMFDSEDDIVGTAYNNLPTGVYYMKLHTRCDGSDSPEIITNMVNHTNQLFELIPFNSSGVVLVYCKQNGNVMQAPFTTLLTVQVQWTDASNNNHTDFENVTLHTGDTAATVVLHTGSGEVVNAIIVMNANPKTNGTATYNY